MSQRKSNQKYWGTVPGGKMYSECPQHPFKVKPWMNELWKYKKDMPVFHGLHQGIWQGVACCMCMEKIYKKSKTFTGTRQQQCKLMEKSGHFFFQTGVMSVRHVCFPQTSSPFYSEVIMWNPEIYPGIKVGRHNIRTWYTGNTIAGNKQNLQRLRDIAVAGSREKALELNRKKDKSNFCPQVSIFYQQEQSWAGDQIQFKYFGTSISTDGRNNTEISSSIVRAKWVPGNEINTNK